MGTSPPLLSCDFELQAEESGTIAGKKGVASGKI
jgi:hypothetical protein